MEIKTTIITFAFLFAVMYGDIFHGSVGGLILALETPPESNPIITGIIISYFTFGK